MSAALGREREGLRRRGDSARKSCEGGVREREVEDGRAGGNGSREERGSFGAGVLRDEGRWLEEKFIVVVGGEYVWAKGGRGRRSVAAACIFLT
jgi:hypothetical protein